MVLDSTKSFTYIHLVCKFKSVASFITVTYLIRQLIPVPLDNLVARLGFDHPLCLKPCWCLL